MLAVCASLTLGHDCKTRIEVTSHAATSLTPAHYYNLANL